MKNVTLSVDLVNAVLQYLSSKPYNEVTNLISAIQAEASNQAVAAPAEAAPADEASVGGTD